MSSSFSSPTLVFEIPNTLTINPTSVDYSLNSTFQSDAPQKLPQDVLHCIFAYLTAKEITAASSTCQNYHHSFTRLTPRILRNQGRQVSLQLSLPQLTLFLRCPHFRFQLLHLSCLPIDNAARDYQSPVPRQSFYLLTPVLLSTIAAQLPQLETLECAVASVEKKPEPNDSNGSNDSTIASPPLSSSHHLIFPSQLEKLHVSYTSSPAQVSSNLTRVLSGIVESNMQQLADLTFSCGWLQIGVPSPPVLAPNALDGLAALRSSLRRLTFTRVMPWEKTHFAAFRQLSSLEYFHSPQLRSLELSWLVAPSEDADSSPPPLLLKQVDITGIAFSDGHAQALSPLSSLTVFAPQTYTCLDSLFLSRFPHLHTVSLMCTSRVSIASLCETLSHTTLSNHLATLTLAHPNINGSEMVDLMTGLNALTELNLSGVPQVKSLEFLVPDAPFHRTLQRFSLQEFVLPTLDELKHLSLLQGLRELHLERCSTAGRIGALITMQEMLRVLKDDDGFRVAREQLQRLVVH